MTDRTEWFPGGVKPIRKGVYERMYRVGKTQIYRFNNWNGIFWGMSSFNPHDAAKFGDEEAPNQSLFWRGLTEKP